MGVLHANIVLVMKQEKLKRLLATSFKKENVKRWLPLVVLLVLAIGSFIYGWYFDMSKPHSGIGWAD